MQAQFKKDEGFKPFEFTIKVETLRELEVLWTIANGSFSQMTHFLNKSKSESFKDFWENEDAIRAFSNSTWEEFNKRLPK